jgi:hypothetical protein
VLDVSGRILGLEQTRKELALLDATVRKELRKEARNITKPLVQDAKNRYPSTAKGRSPLRGVNYAWRDVGGDGFPYNQARAKRGVRFTCDITRKGRTVFRVRQIDAAATVLEVAGRTTSLGRAVSSRFGARDRFMWKAAVRTGPAVRRELQSAIDSLVRGINRKNERDAR